MSTHFITRPRSLLAIAHLELNRQRIRQSLDTQLLGRLRLPISTAFPTRIRFAHQRLFGRVSSQAAREAECARR